MRHGHATASSLTVLLTVGLLALPRAAPVLERVVQAGGTGSAVAGLPARAVTTHLPTTCGAEPHDATGWAAVFDRLDGGWSGGDGASSSRLPDGRLLWLFGDTVTTGTGDDGRGLGAARLVHNSVLISTGTCVTSIAAGREALPSTGRTWLWPTHAVVTRPGGPGTVSAVAVFAQRVARTGDGPFDFRRVATSVVLLRVAWLGPVTVGPVRDVAGADILWAAAALDDGATTWLYGTRDAGPGTFGRDLLLARAPTAAVARPESWRFRSVHGWSHDEVDAVVVRPGTAGVSTVLSAARVGRRYVLVTKHQEFLDDRVVALTSTTAWGPWTERTLLKVPSAPEVPRYSPALVAGATSEHAVVVVSRTSTSLHRLLAGTSTARPTFHDVDLAA